MHQTPVHEQHNPDLLRLIPLTTRRVVEVGCSSGALAREYKKLNVGCHYLGIDIDPTYAKLAERYCDEVLVLDIEQITESYLAEHLAADCWIFGDSIEHLMDPWRLLQTIRSHIPPDGCIVTCIPNMQHWSIQAKLNDGRLRYEDSGLLDRTHLRWFTRTTMVEMFHMARFKIVEGFPRIFNEPGRDRVLNAIRAMAQLLGADPERAVSDALPLQYVVRAVPT